MSTKFLKYGIGIFTPEFPASFDAACFDQTKTKPKPIVITIPDDSVNSEQVPVVFDDSNRDVQIIVGKNAVVSFIETMSGSPRYGRLVMSVSEGAVVSYKIAYNKTASVDIMQRDISLAQNAKLDWVEWVSSPVFMRSTTEVQLEGEAASIECHAAYIGIEEQSFDSNLRILHLAPHTRSNIMTRTILNDKAKAIVRGLVRIPKGIAGCVGFQREDALLLSPKVVVSAIPMLEIENSDVKCGHAATIGRIDEEKMFYLMSRGLDRDAAVQVIVDGFLEPISSLIWTSR